MSASLRRLLFAMLLVTAVILIGGLALFVLGAGRWRLSESLYMAVISVSTVGFGELPGLDAVPGGRGITVAIILTGIGAFAYFQSALTAFVVEGVVGTAWRRNRMKQKIGALGDHVVVTGVGSTGRHVIEELVATGMPFVAVDRNAEHLERVNHEVAAGAMLYVHGDATEDHVLLAAGVDRARGVIAALTNDKDNLFVTLTARTLNARARIVAKVVEPEAQAKMVRAGANATVSPNIIGGRRLASELIRPDVVEFMDQMLRDRERKLRFSDVAVPPHSRFVGKPLAALPGRAHADVMLVAARAPDRQFVYNPPADYVLRAGTVLIVLGEEAEARKLEALLLHDAPAT